MVNVSYVVSFDKVECSLECAVLVVVINKFGPVSRGDGDEDIVQ